MRRFIPRFARRTPSLAELQSYADVSSKWLSRAACILACFAAGGVFLLVLSLAILPYITLTHTLCLAPACAFLVAALVYGFASRPADIADKTSRGLWLTRMAISLAKRLAARKSG